MSKQETRRDVFVFAHWEGMDDPQEKSDCE